MKLGRQHDATPNGPAQPNRKTIDSDASRVAPRRHRSPGRRSADHARRRKAVRGVELYVHEHAARAPVLGPGGVVVAGAQCRYSFEHAWADALAPAPAPPR